MHSKSTCEVIQTYDGYVVQLEGDRTNRLAHQRFMSDSAAEFMYDWLILDVVGKVDRWGTVTHEGYRWSDQNHIITFKTLTEAVAMAERIEEVLNERELQRLRGLAAAAEQMRIQREREAFVEKKVWR